jgi:5-methylcytosine-specific restriction endonuclease McrA
LLRQKENQPVKNETANSSRAPECDKRSVSNACGPERERGWIGALTTATASFKEGGKGRNKAQKRLLLWQQQHGLCAVCDSPLAIRDATLDHIIPRTKGGPNTYANLRATHEACNKNRKASMDDVCCLAGGVKALRWFVKELP